jgi:hypothetical protein
MNAVDSAIVRGRVVGEPQYVKNDGVTRCLFTIGLESRFDPSDAPAPGEGQVDRVKYFQVQAIAESDLTERCRTLLDNGDDVIAMGDFGFHKGRLKLRVKKINLPQIPGEGTPTV